MASIHDGIKHECSICEKNFVVKNSLQRHINSVHEKIKPYQCSICEKNFAQKHHLQKHIESVHGEMKPHKCSIK
jgi:uncharacterized Zn-finger protein